MSNDEKQLLLTINNLDDNINTILNGQSNIKYKIYIIIIIQSLNYNINCIIINYNSYKFI